MPVRVRLRAFFSLSKNLKNYLKIYYILGKIIYVIDFQSCLPETQTPWYTDWNELLGELDGWRNFVVETARVKTNDYSFELLNREICIIPTLY